MKRLHAFFSSNEENGSFSMLIWTVCVTLPGYSQDAAMAMDGDAALAMALRMSMEEAGGDGGVEDGGDEKDADDDNDDDEDDDDLAAALAMSMSSAPSTPAPASEAAAPPVSPSGVTFSDPSFVQSMLSRLPGVDMDDPRIRDALAAISGGENTGEGDEEGSSEKGGDSSKE